MNIYIRSEGMYKIRLADLADIDNGYRLIPADQISIFHRGVKIPVWLHGEGENSGLVFFGQESDSLYSNENIYQLRTSNGDQELSKSLPVAKNDIWTDEPGRNHTSLAFFEQNKVYQPLVNSTDKWMWESLSAPANFEFNFSLDSVISQQGLLTIQFWASTENVLSPDHHLRLFLNQQQILDFEFDGKGIQKKQVNIPEGVLKKGNNKFEMQVPGDTGVPVDIVWLDWIQILYPVIPEPQNDYLDIFKGENSLTFKDFSGRVDIFDITDKNRPLNIAWQLDHLKSLDQNYGRHLIIVGPQGYKIPDRIVKAKFQNDLRKNGLGANLLAIGQNELLESLSPLLELRQSQGFITSAIDVQIIYDQFNDGLPEPEAIRSFLWHTQVNWDPSPKYILLVGDATYDPKGYLENSTINHLPTFFINTTFGGETASDLGYTIFGKSPWVETRETNREIPSIAIGRIPAQSQQHVVEFVEKILAYEKTVNITPVRSKVLAIADGQDASFKGDAQYFLSNFPKLYDKELYSPIAGSLDSNLKIIQFWEEGYQWIAYFGHGSITQWGKDRIFEVKDVSSLKNQDKYPIVLNFTCLTGFFVHPKQVSLTEALLWNHKNGTMAVLAPTSLTLASDQKLLLDAILQGLNNSSIKYIGDLILEGWRTIPVDVSGEIEVRDTFLLFGDPTLRLPQENN